MLADLIAKYGVPDEAPEDPPAKTQYRKKEYEKKARQKRRDKLTAAYASKFSSDADKMFNNL